IYIPGGRAAYPSTVLMTAVPARVAGVKEIVLVTPPGADGSVNPVVLAAARVAGVTEGWRIGGAQAVAALAYGTATIRRVDKIVGPGNIYVALAKTRVVGEVGIDMMAGPSEVVVVADAAADPDWIAVELLAPAEREPMARAAPISDAPALAPTAANALGARRGRAGRHRGGPARPGRARPDGACRADHRRPGAGPARREGAGSAARHAAAARDRGRRAARPRRADPDREPRARRRDRQPPGPR